MPTKRVKVDPLSSMLDFTAPKYVQVEWVKSRGVLYVHVDGITQLRCCRIEQFKFEEK